MITAKLYLWSTFDGHLCFIPILKGVNRFQLMSFNPHAWVKLMCCKPCQGLCCWMWLKVRYHIKIFVLILLLWNHIAEVYIVTIGMFNHDRCLSTCNERSFMCSCSASKIYRCRPQMYIPTIYNRLIFFIWIILSLCHYLSRASCMNSLDYLCKLLYVFLLGTLCCRFTLGVNQLIKMINFVSHLLTFTICF